MQVEKYTTNKGKDGIIVDGYKYRFDKAFKNTNLWRCGARCKTDLTDLMVLDGRTDHNHEIEDNRKVQQSKLRQACQCKAVDDITERPQKLIIAECGKTENDTLVPEDISTIRQAVYRVRRRTQQKLPKSREETHVNLKDYEFNSTSGKRMMHVNDPETGIIMFTTEGNIEYICQPDVEIFGDGTFKYCPRYFYQLYTLLGYKNGHYVPCVFFLLPSKSGECYTNMFRHLIEVARDFGHNFQLTSIHLDFEDAVFEAARVF
jgi:hypothetical protein